MYPILSVLRRFAATQILVRPQQLEASDKRYWVRLKSPSSHWDLIRCSWGLTHTLAPMYEIRVTAGSSESAAIAIVEKENALAEKMKASETYYTLVLGPETEKESNGQFTRCVRLSVVRGVYRASAPSAIEPAPVKNSISRKFAKPRGVIYEEQ